MVLQTNVAATTGATYGISMHARTRPLPRNGLRRASAARSPNPIAQAVPATEYTSVVTSASMKPGEVRTSLKFSRL
jgi:hypothetical protein